MRIIKKKRKSKEKEFIPVSTKIDENIETLDNIFKDCTDIVAREFRVGVEQNHRMYVAYVDGLADRTLVHDHILRPLALEARLIAPDPGVVKRKLFELTSEGTLSASDIKEKDNLDEAVLAILSGDTILLIDGVSEFIIISTRGWPLRGLSEPPGETVIRGPREGFIETFRVNTVLLRRKIRDPKLKIKGMQLGERSKTDIGIAYMEDIVNEKVLKELENRLETIDIDGILESGYVEQLIEDNWFSLFPQVQYTERPDLVAAALLQGKVAIIIDNTPMTLIVPATFNDFMQSPEDYYERWWIANLIRWIRLFALIISFTLPAIYIAIASYHPGIIPTSLAIFLAGTRETVPFPVFVEALVMEITFELLREAGVRLPSQIGATIGIVGSLIIGQAAVEAGLVSPIMVIIVALTAISSFAVPSYNLNISFRLLRFVAMLAASFLGLYGLVLVVIATLIHLSTINSFGVPYLAPIVSGKMSDLKDTVVKAPFPNLKSRNSFTGEKDKKRLKDWRVDKNGKTVKVVSDEEENSQDIQAKEGIKTLKKPKKVGETKKGGEKDE
jgi:spore germination protein